MIFLTLPWYILIFFQPSLKVLKLRVINSLHDNKGIVSLVLDYGNRVIMFNIVDYIEDINDIINDKHTFGEMYSCSLLIKKS